MGFWQKDIRKLLRSLLDSLKLMDLYSCNCQVRVAPSLEVAWFFSPFCTPLFYPLRDGWVNHKVLLISYKLCLNCFLKWNEIRKSWCFENSFYHCRTEVPLAETLARQFCMELVFGSPYYFLHKFYAP